MNSLDPQIYFLNHASLQINYGETTLLCDPWFTGSVFNKSWALLKESQPDWSTFRRELSVWISHEHPDHLHFQTLKEIRSRHSGPIRIFYRNQPNKNVKDALLALGFELEELEERETHEVADQFKITQYSHGSDSAVIVEVGEKILLNQNDCLLSSKTIKLLKDRFPKIDLWFFQFSLAGYYGNEDDLKRLNAAHDLHLVLIKRYSDLIQPSVFIPFASFIYFSKRGNSYLNKYRVTPAEALQVIGNKKTQLLWFGDQVLYKDWQSRNLTNVESWAKIWNDGKAIDDDVLLPDEEILSNAQNSLKDFAIIPRCLRPGPTIIRLRESQRDLEIDLRSQTVSLLQAASCKLQAAEVGEEDFLFFLKFPWGADTLNITGNLKIINQLSWRRIAYLKHVIYAMRDLPGWQKGLIAYVGAVVRTLQFKFRG